MSLSEIRTELRHGNCLAAIDLADQLISEGRRGFDCLYLKVLALARSGATQRALALYREFDLAQSSNPDHWTLKARLLKDFAFTVGEPELRLPLIKAAKAYDAIFAKTKDTYPAINAATLYYLAGEKDQARKLADDIISLELQKSSLGYFEHATLAEAYLLKGLENKSAVALTCAFETAPENFAAISATRRNLLKVANAEPSLKEFGIRVLTILKLPKVAVYTGRMFCGLQNDIEGGEEVLSAQVLKVMKEQGIGFFYGALACGGDIVFAECAARLHIELNLVLPITEADYIRESVAPGGDRWLPRYNTVRGKANLVHFATEDPYVGDPLQFDFGSSVAMGIAKLRAQALGTEVIQLALWDDVSDTRVTGTSTDIAKWKKIGGQTVVIKPPPLDRNMSFDQTRELALEETREQRAIIFADFPGFTEISEEHIPAFRRLIFKQAAVIIERFRPSVLYKNSWGDALYLVVDTVGKAAELVLELQKAFAGIDFSMLGFSEPRYMRFGLHFGPVYSEIDPLFGERTFYGAQVSKAARIEPITPPGEVYVTEQFAAMLALTGITMFECGYVGQVPLAKGYGTFRMYRLAKK